MEEEKEREYKTFEDIESAQAYFGAAWRYVRRDIQNKINELKTIESKLEYLNKLAKEKREIENESTNNNSDLIVDSEDI